jgi:hypothetical protein
LPLQKVVKVDLVERIHQFSKEGLNWVLCLRLFVLLFGVRKLLIFALLFLFDSPFEHIMVEILETVWLGTLKQTFEPCFVLISELKISDLSYVEKVNVLIFIVYKLVLLLVRSVLFEHNLIAEALHLLFFLL